MLLTNCFVSKCGGIWTGLSAEGRGGYDRMLQDDVDEYVTLRLWRSYQRCHTGLIISPH